MPLSEAIWRRRLSWIARENAPRIDGRHVPDLRKLADTFRKWRSEKSIPLDGSSIEKTFTTWCKSYSAR